MKRWIIRCIEWDTPDDFWKDYSGIIHDNIETARRQQSNIKLTYL